MKPATFALLLSSAAMALKAVHQALDDHPQTAGKIPRAWRSFLAEVAFFHESFGRHRDSIDPQ